MAHRLVMTLGGVGAGPAQHELALGQSRDGGADGGDVDAARRCAHAVEQARLVALGLQPADHPCPCVGQRLVVEVDRVLGGQHHAHTEGPGLLHQRHDGRLRGRRRRGGHVPRHLVEVHHGPQVGGTRLPPHPRDDLGQHERGDELALLLTEVGRRDDRGRRPPVALEQGVDVEGRALPTPRRRVTPAAR